MKNVKLLLFISITILFAVFLVQQNKNPYIGIYVVGNEQGDFYVEGLRDLGWGWYNGIEHGDVIESIDDEQPGKNNIVSEYGRIEQAETLTVNQNGMEKTYQIDYSSVILQQGLIYWMLPALYFLALRHLVLKNQINRTKRFYQFTV